MKKIIIGIFLMLGVASCLAPPANSSQSTSSTEVEARTLTTQMKNALELNQTQEQKILVINVVNISLMKKLRESNQTNQISTTQAKYKSEMKEVLDAEQYSKFLANFGNI